MSHSLLAIQGELNYGFATPQNTIVVEDTAKIDACNKSLTELQAKHVNCQTSAVTLQKSLEIKNGVIQSQQQLIFVLMITVIVLIVVLTFFLVKFFRLRRKNAA